MSNCTGRVVSDKKKVFDDLLLPVNDLIDDGSTHAIDELMKVSLAFAALPSGETLLYPLSSIVDNNMLTNVITIQGEPKISVFGNMLASMNILHPFHGEYDTDCFEYSRHIATTSKPLPPYVQLCLEMFPEYLFVCGGEVLKSSGLDLASRYSWQDEYHRSSYEDIDIFVVVPEDVENREDLATFMVKDSIFAIKKYISEDPILSENVEVVVAKGKYHVTVSFHEYDSERDERHNLIKVQFILRIYPNAASIVHGFDLSICKFFRDASGEIYGTPDAWISALTGLLPMDIGNLSLSYGHRLRKYLINYGLGLYVPGLSMLSCHKKDICKWADTYVFGTKELMVYVTASSYALHGRINENDKVVENISDYSGAKATRLQQLAIAHLTGNYDYVTALLRAKEYDIQASEKCEDRFRRLSDKFEYSRIVTALFSRLPKKKKDELSLMKVMDEINGTWNYETTMGEAIKFAIYADYPGTEGYELLEKVKKFNWITKRPGRQGKISARIHPVRIDADEWYTTHTDQYLSLMPKVRRKCILGVTNFEYLAIKKVIQRACEAKGFAYCHDVTKLICDALRLKHLKAKASFC